MNKLDVVVFVSVGLCQEDSAGRGETRGLGVSVRRPAGERRAGLPLLQRQDRRHFPLEG